MSPPPKLEHFFWKMSPPQKCSILRNKSCRGYIKRKTYAQGSLKSDLKVAQKWSKSRLEVA